MRCAEHLLHAVARPLGCSTEFTSPSHPDASLDSQRYSMSIRLLSAIFAFAAIAAAQTFHPYSIFATGTAVSATGPDSITVGNGSVWVSYTNGADSTGAFGSSTVVQYNLGGKVRHTYSIAGSVDGLKIEPQTDLVWALQNQDGNSALTLIDPLHGTTSSLQYAVTSPSHGFDDVAFDGDKIFLSYTNPVLASDPTIQLLENRTSPLIVTPVLTWTRRASTLQLGKAISPLRKTIPIR